MGPAALWNLSKRMYSLLPESYIFVEFTGEFTTVKMHNNIFGANQSVLLTCSSHLEHNLPYPYFSNKKHNLETHILNISPLQNHSEKVEAYIWRYARHDYCWYMVQKDGITRACTRINVKHDKLWKHDPLSPVYTISHLFTILLIHHDTQLDAYKKHFDGCAHIVIFG